MMGRLDHVGVIVADIVAARRLLEDVIGLELKREHHSTGTRVDAAFLGFDSDPYSGALVELVELGDPEVRSRRLGPDAVARIEHIAIEVEDVEAAQEELRARGIEMQSDSPSITGTTRSYFTRPETTCGIIFQFLDRHVVISGT
jgi:methylmalonyl-CoA/ethylmalonyl-CoA epimerase